jgi:hypothetical protein
MENRERPLHRRRTRELALGSSKRFGARRDEVSDGAGAARRLAPFFLLVRRKSAASDKLRQIGSIAKFLTGD